MGRRQPPQSLKLVVEHFKPLKDPRIDRTKLHPLENILVMTLSASISGAEGWDEIARFAEAREEWYATFLDMPGGTPSADTFRRLFERLSPVKFEECFRSWVDALAEEFAGEVIAIDGKTLRGAVDKAGKKTQLHMVHVWATTQNLLLAQKAVEGGASGEMAAIPKLLKVLDLEGAIVTTDANSCTAAVTRAIIENKADYVLAVKGNRGRFYDHVVNAFAGREQFAADFKHTTFDEGHGRKETRVVSVLEPEDWHGRPRTTGSGLGSARRPGSSARVRSSAGRPAPRSSTSCPAFPLTPRRSARRFELTGASRTASTGRSTSPSATTAAACAMLGPPRTLPPSTGSRCCSSSTRQHARTGSSASG